MKRIAGFLLLSVSYIGLGFMFCPVLFAILIIAAAVYPPAWTLFWIAVACAAVGGLTAALNPKSLNL